MRHFKIFLATALIFISSQAFCQQRNVNYDETKVPKYDLPDPLTTPDGRKITTKIDWEKHRAEVLTLFEDQMFGSIPQKKITTTFELIESSDSVLEGTARRRQVRATFSNGTVSHSMNMLIYLPAQAEKPVPVFVGLNFNGNHAINADPAILISQAWLENRDNAQDPEATRGTATRRWPVELIVSRGYGVATIFCGDIDPDFDDGFQNGIHKLFFGEGKTPAKNEMATIAAWSWGLSRVMDYFAQSSEIDAKRVAVIGHSRLGKTSVWAGASDPRFALVISNDSGCGGAALSKRAFGETVEIINTAFPHWFCGNFKQYNSNEASLPFDQHMLLALIAPRPLAVASASEDRWADPKGEFLSLIHAQAVYNLYSSNELEIDDMPEPDDAVETESLHYHLRDGKHDIIEFDWKQYLDFADRVL